MKFFLSCLLILITSQLSFAQSFFADNGKVVFESSVPLHTFEGSSQLLTGMVDLEANTVDFYLDLETLDTGNNKRDKDMKLTLETEDYPFAEFFGTLENLIDLSSSEPQPVQVTGEFKLHGITRPVDVDGSITVTNEGLLVEASWILLLNDYQIKPPQLLIMKVDQEQKIRINILLTPYVSSDDE